MVGGKHDAGGRAEQDAAVAPKRLFTWKVVLAIAAFTLTYLGIWAAVEAGGGGMLAIDEAAYNAISLGLRSDTMTTVMEAISTLGTTAAITAMIVVVIALASSRSTGWWCAASAICIHFLSKLLKNLACRPRPDAALQLVAEVGYSFPSGHTMNAVALFGLFAWFAWRSDRPRWERVVYCVVFGAAAALVGVSRIYLGVHYLTDVLAGACASIVWLVLFTRVILAVERALARRRGGGAAGEVAEEGLTVSAGASLGRHLAAAQTGAQAASSRPSGRHFAS